MLHNSPEGIPDKAIYSIVGHSLGKDAHMKNYMAGLKPQPLIKAVEAIDWDTWGVALEAVIREAQLSP